MAKSRFTKTCEALFTGGCGTCESPPLLFVLFLEISSTIPSHFTLCFILFFRIDLSVHAVEKRGERGIGVWPVPYLARPR